MTQMLIDSSKTPPVQYELRRVLGNGSFGVVYEAWDSSSGKLVAIKKVLQDRRFKNREITIMKMTDHSCCVKMVNHFYQQTTVVNRGIQEQGMYLHLVLEFVPETLYRWVRRHRKMSVSVDSDTVRVFMYQLFRSLAYIHCQGIVHRDIKPQNLLINGDTGVLKLCDFGSAKVIGPQDQNVAYICSRYYRAPELIFGATYYNSMIDMWSAGCVFCEVLAGLPIFPGESGVDQMVEIIKVLGSPGEEDIRAMNPAYKDFVFPPIRPRTWNDLMRSVNAPREAIDLISKILVYRPMDRPTALEALAHPYFDPIREPEFTHQLYPDGDKGQTGFFDFKDEELYMYPGLRDHLIPPHAMAKNKSLSDEFKAGTVRSNIANAEKILPHTAHVHAAKVASARGAAYEEPWDPRSPNNYGARSQ